MAYLDSRNFGLSSKKLNFTPLEFETRNAHSLMLAESKCKFTPMEFEASSPE